MSAPYIFRAVKCSPETAACIEVELIMKSDLAALGAVVEELLCLRPKT